MSVRVTAEWTYRGLQALVLGNDELRVVILPELGGKIWQLTDTRDNRDFLWHNPRVKPRRVPFGAVYDERRDHRDGRALQRVQRGDRGTSRRNRRGERPMKITAVDAFYLSMPEVLDIGDALRVARYARERGVRFVNHTFTSHLALSASLQPFVGSGADWLCEYLDTEVAVEGRTLYRTPDLVP
jgi:hypothetical protein